MTLSDRLPPAVQTGLAAVRDRAEAGAAARGGPIADLSIGAPIDPTPAFIGEALAAAGDAPGYPLTVGRPELRAAYVDWLERVHGVTGVGTDAVLPVVGTKELIGSLALHLDLTDPDGADRLTVGLPALAYPTYAVGAALIGATTVVVDGLADYEALARAGAAPGLLWVNSPANPTGRVLAVDELAGLVAACRAHGTLLVSDECYLDLGYDVAPASALRPEVSGTDHSGVLAVHSLSKRSNLAGYRCGFVSGDPALVAELALVRRNLGLQLPIPMQAAALAALGDEAHVEVQRERYAGRRSVLRPAVEAAGFRVDHGEAGLYVWATRGEPAALTVGRLADLGVLVVAGTEYGAAGAEHVRLSLTASDADVALAADLIAAASW